MLPSWWLERVGMRRIEIYVTTLRDGTQGEGVAFSLVDKLKITEQLDMLGVDFVEGGIRSRIPRTRPTSRKCGN